MRERIAVLPWVTSGPTGRKIYPWLCTAFVIAMLQALVLATAWGQTEAADTPALSIVEVEGTVSSVELNSDSGGGAMQRGCLLQVKTKQGKVISVRLGPMRYLMEHSFSPRSGDEVRVRGYSRSQSDEDGDLVALSVSLPGRGQELELRDEDGRPVWSGQRRRQRHGQGKR